MKNTLINLDKISNITLHSNKKCNFYKYKKSKWMLGLRSKGLYEYGTITGIPKKIEKLPDYLELREDEIYYKPYITIYHIDGWCEKHFNSEQELNDYVKVNFSKFLKIDNE